MRTSLEWVFESAAAAILLGIIFIGVHMGIISADTAISKESNTPAAIDEAQKEPLPLEHQIEGFDIILQMPELPTGCEITAMTMALNYYGLKADKVDMAKIYLPTAPAEFSYDSDGRLHGPDLTQYFVGDPAASNGYICGTGAIRTAANRYLYQEGSSLRAVDKTKASLEELYRWVSENIPVVVWVTIGMEERQGVKGWYTENGEYVDWAGNDHGAVLIGYTENTVTIADPISGKTEYRREMFERIFSDRGSQCVILQK